MKINGCLTSMASSSLSGTNLKVMGIPSFSPKFLFKEAKKIFEEICSFEISQIFAKCIV